MNNKALAQYQITEAVHLANTAPYAPAPAGGCGRAYVILTGPKEQIKLVVKACTALGLMFLKKAYGTAGNAIYIGYDNADGRALGKSEAFAQALNEHGVPCYADAVSD